MHHARLAAGIHTLLKGLVKAQVGQVPFQDEDLLPVVVAGWALG
jgi:hypothetical protein